MDVEVAKRAGEVAELITKLEPLVVQLEMYKKNGWRITGLRVKSADGSQETMQPIEPLDDVASAAALDYAIRIYRDSVTKTQAELDAL